MEEEPTVFLIFAGVPRPPPPRFAEAVLGGLARVGVVRPGNFTVQLRDGGHLGLLVGLVGSDVSVEQLRKVPMMSLVVMQYLVCEVLWNPKLGVRHPPWVDYVRCAVLNEQLTLIRHDLEINGATEDSIQKQLQFIQGELRAVLKV